MKLGINDTRLIAIGNAIRNKKGTQDLYTLADMPDAIASIETGYPEPTGTISITQNGTQNVKDYASANVNVPNSYGASDEGKVVDNGELVAQTSRTIDTNGTYDTTLNNEVVVDVEGGGGGASIPTPAIPAMTSDTTPSGEASASSTLNTNFKAYRAFDGTQAQSTMQGGWLASNADVSPWLKYEFDTPILCHEILIWTANNGATATRTVAIEGLKEGVWENALKTGNTATLTFTQGTYGESSVLHEIELNDEWYEAIRISGNEPFYMGANQTACTFSEVQVYTLKYDLISKTITQNGTYNAGDDNADGYDEVIVNVSGGAEPIDYSYLPNSVKADVLASSDYTMEERGNFGKLHVVPYTVSADVSYTIDTNGAFLPRGIGLYFLLGEVNPSATVYYVGKRDAVANDYMPIALPYAYSSYNCPCFYGANSVGAKVVYSTYNTNTTIEDKYIQDEHVYAMSIDGENKVAKFYLDGAYIGQKSFSNCGNTVVFSKGSPIGSGFEANAYFKYGAVVDGIESDATIIANMQTIATKLGLTI